MYLSLRVSSWHRVQVRAGARTLSEGCMRGRIAEVHVTCTYWSRVSEIKSKSQCNSFNPSNSPLKEIEHTADAAQCLVVAEVTHASRFIIHHLHNTRVSVPLFACVNKKKIVRFAE